MKRVELIEKLKLGEALFGFFCASNSTSMTEIAANGGADFIVHDAEHGEVSTRVITNLCLATSSRGALSIVRVPRIDRRTVGLCLDFGANGIIAPMIESIGEAEAMLDYMLYPPQGSRGLALTRNFNYGNKTDIPIEMEKSNDEVLAIIQIETQAGLKNLSQILSLERVDMVFIGPADLSASLGCPMQFEHPTFLEAMIDIIFQVKASGKLVGALISEPQQVQKLYALGIRFFATYFEALVSESCQGFGEKTREVINSF